MSTSTHVAHIRMAQSTLDNAGFDTGLAKVVINNLLHAADSHGNVLANWTRRVLPSTDTATASMASKGGARRPVELWTSGAFFLRLDKDGVPYPVRVGVQGLRTAGSGSTDLIIVLTTAITPAQLREDMSAGNPNSTTGTTSSGTAAWLTLGSNLLQLDTFQTQRGMVLLETIDAIGGDPTVVRVCMARVSIWGDGDDGSLTGVYAAEWGDV